ncbi:PP2C family protein-serine/threonine phosphatase [Streptomyces sp. JB150]|uniref:PP2C family protein-serine/threonine phosphatase n=1 Tax=Streptomyces sp. JB150 TaxID=2714844 RepID=UPI0014078B49|nr:PP2C family protein-serine/threonine phosphatase [Streptomyces sp. JB150]QIJ61702.1 serine/threonine-protein phosphatase [Streptomyces sp. JB150]
MIRIRARGPGRRLLALGLPTAWGALAVTYKLGCPLAQQNGLGARIATSAVFFAVGTGLVLHVRHVLLRELKQVREVAGAAQSTLLRPLPSEVDGLRVAAAQLSADRGAAVGGDLYEVVATEHGVRAVMGDVRGHGIGAVGTVAAVLGSFREAVHDEPDLGRVLRRLDRALARHLRERAAADPESPVAEDFVTVLLLEIGREGEVRVLNCGHPWPYRLLDTRVEPLSRAEPLPPLGPFPLPPELPAVACPSLRPNEVLFLHTDGAEDARDAHGRFFPLAAVLAAALGAGARTPQALLAAVFTRLLRHTQGAPADDVAFLVLRDERPRRRAPSGSRAAARSATTCPQPTKHL